MTRVSHHRFSLARVAVLALVALALAGCSLASEPIPAGPIQTGPLPGEEAAAAVPASLPSAATGAQVYAGHCAECHGADGSGDSPMAAQLRDQGAFLPDFTDPDLGRLRSPAEWYEIITNGRMRAFMPPWAGTLTDAERWSAAYYLYTFSADEAMLAEGERLYEEHFAAGLGDQGEAAGLDMETLAGLSRQAIIDEYLADAGSDLSRDELLAVAAYVQTFGYDPALPAVAEEPPAPGAEAPADEPVEEAAGEAPAEEPPAAGEGEAAPTAAIGTVSGRVTMATPGEPLPEGLEVQLRGVGVDETNQIYEFLVQTQPVGPEGEYQFTDVPFDVERAAYVVEVIHNGVVFQNGAFIDPAQPNLELPLEVYATTTDESVVVVDAMHVVFSEHPDALLVTQLYVFSNQSDRIYVTDEPVAGGRRGSVAISLPPEAYGVQFQDGQIGGRFVQANGRYYDTQQFPPGERSLAIIVNYFLPFDGSAEIEIPVLYQTRQVTVLAQEGQQARSDMLTQAGEEIIEQNVYTQYVGQSLAAGDTLALTLRAGAGVGGALPVILAVLAGVLLVAGIGYWVYQRSMGDLPEPVAAGLSERASALIAEIAALDDAFEAGRINRFEHEARRAALKAELAAEMAGEQGRDD